MSVIERWRLWRRGVAAVAGIVIIYERTTFCARHSSIKSASLHALCGNERDAWLAYQQNGVSTWRRLNIFAVCQRGALIVAL